MRRKSIKTRFTTQSVRSIRARLTMVWSLVLIVSLISAMLVGAWTLIHSGHADLVEQVIPWQIVSSVICVLFGCALGAILSKRITGFVETQLAELRSTAHDVGHELATPVAVLRSRLQVMEREVDPEHPNADLQVLNEATSRLTVLIDDMRVLANAESPDRQRALALVKMDTLVKSLVGQFSNDFSSRNISVDIEDVQSVTVVGERESIERLVANLLSNAARYAKQSGNVRVRLSVQGSWFQLSVSNDGAAIEPDEMPYLFDRFYRTEASKNREASGSGLGLAIVKAIVEAHFGEVEVVSEPGLETTFTVRLPKFPPVHPLAALNSQ